MKDFIDLQVNGYAGVDFNSDGLTREAMEAACRRLSEDGVAGTLATVITDDFGAMERRIENIARFWTESSAVRQVVVGIHIEGPFISDRDGFVGTHPRAAVIPADPELARRLVDIGQGLVRLFTLAPERDAGCRTIQWLAGQGICVAAGHCDPSLKQLQRAIDAGLSAFTHLGNGCPLLMHRHDNIVQRALACADDLWLCFIADGIHVPFPA